MAVLVNSPPQARACVCDGRPGGGGNGGGGGKGGGGGHGGGGGNGVRPVAAIVCLSARTTGVCVCVM
eukprot:2410404-Prymnesium_polylepis.1